MEGPEEEAVFSRQVMLGSTPVFATELCHLEVACLFAFKSGDCCGGESRGEEGSWRGQSRAHSNCSNVGPLSYGTALLPAGKPRSQQAGTPRQRRVLAHFS